MAVTIWRMFCYLLKKRGKGKQVIWTTQYVIVEKLTNAHCCFVANKSQKSPELLGSSGFFIYLCSRVIILSVGVHPFLW